MLLVIPIWFFIMVTALCRRVDSFAPYGREASTCKQRNTMISVVMRCETWIVQKANTHKSQVKKHLRVYSVVTFSILREANRSSPRPSVNVAVIVQVLSLAATSLENIFLGTGDGAADEEEGLLSDLVCDEEEQDESTEYFLATDTGSVAATKAVEPIVTLELSET